MLEFQFSDQPNVKMYMDEKNASHLVTQALHKPRGKISLADQDRPHKRHGAES